MPSRRPSGVYVRGTSDWYTQKGGMIGGGMTITVKKDIAFDLYNGNQAGQNVFVYKVWVFIDGEGAFVMNQIQGHGANLVESAFPLVYVNPFPGVQLYQDALDQTFSSDSLYPEDTAVGGLWVGGDESGGEIPIEAPGPLAVIPPGYSLRMRALNSSFFAAGDSFGVSFYFAVLPDQGN